MTEKRLIVRDGDYAWVDTVTDTVIEVEDAFDLVNALHEENTMLKERRHEDINDLSVIAMKYKALEKENEQLKEKLSTEKPILDYFHNRHYYIRDMTTEEIKEWNKTIKKVMEND